MERTLEDFTLELVSIRKEVRILWMDNDSRKFLTTSSKKIVW